MPKRVDHPIILGIVGDSAAGKTTLSAGVERDKNGAPHTYHVLNVHPGNLKPNNLEIILLNVMDSKLIIVSFMG